MVEFVYEEYFLGILRKLDYDSFLDGLVCGRVYVYMYICRIFLIEFVVVGKVFVNEL